MAKRIDNQVKSEPVWPRELVVGMLKQVFKMTSGLMFPLSEKCNSKNNFQDIDAHEKTIKVLVESRSGMTFIGMTKSPFGFRVSAYGITMHVFVNGSRVTGKFSE